MKVFFPTLLSFITKCIIQLSSRDRKALASKWLCEDSLGTGHMNKGNWEHPAVVGIQLDLQSLALLAGVIFEEF